MSDWVHCNKCALRHNNEASFYLTECAHIFCQRCVEKIKASNICSICNKTGHVVLLNKNVEQNVLDFFLPVENHLKKAVEVYEFQIKHRNTLLQNVFEKYNHAKKAYCEAQNTIRKLSKENQMLRMKLFSANGTANYRSQSTPLYAQSASMNPNDVTFQNASPVSTIIQPRSVPRVSTPSEGNQRNMGMFPGYPRRNNMFGSGSSGTLHRPSPAQKVPVGFGKLRPTPPVHRGIPSALEAIRRGTCHQK